MHNNANLEIDVCTHAKKCTDKEVNILLSGRKNLHIFPTIFWEGRHNYLECGNKSTKIFSAEFIFSAIFKGFSLKSFPSILRAKRVCVVCVSYIGGPAVLLSVVAQPPMAGFGVVPVVPSSHVTLRRTDVLDWRMISRQGRGGRVVRGGGRRRMERLSRRREFVAPRVWPRRWAGGRRVVVVVGLV